MKKRIWSILLVLCMALALFPFGALAANGLEGYAEVLNPYYAEVLNPYHDAKDAVYGTYYDLSGDGSPELILIAPDGGVFAMDVYTLENGAAKQIAHEYFSFEQEEPDYSYLGLLRGTDGSLRIMICGQNNTYAGTDEDGVKWYYNFFENHIYSVKGTKISSANVTMREELQSEADANGNFFYIPGESTYLIDHQSKDDEQYYKWYDKFYEKYSLFLYLSGYEQLDGYPIEQLLAAAKGGFVDVPESAYYSMAVDWAVTRGVTNGTSPLTFSPNEFCTRGQVVTFLWRAAGSPAPKKEGNPFKDVSKGAYYYNAVLWAVENGITNGTSATTFSPGDSCTRGQVVTFLYRYAGSPEISAKNPFKDVQKGAYYYSAVQWAVKNGITNGTSDTAFSPSDTCTRGQVVTFLWRGTVHSAFPI